MSIAAASGGSKRRRGLGDLHDDVLERVLARLPPSAFFRLRSVCRRWRAAASSPTFLHACSLLPSRDPWFLMLSSHSPPIAFDAADRSWILPSRASAAAATDAAVPVASSGGLVLYRSPHTGALSVSNPLTGATRALPSPPGTAAPLHAVAMYGSPYRVALFAGDIHDGMSMAVFDSSTATWAPPLALSRKAAPPHAAAADDTAEVVYFLSKSGDVVSTNMQRSASKQYSSAVVTSSSGGVTAYFLSDSGTVVACDTARREYAELPRILPVYFEYSVDVVACGGAAYAVVLAEQLDTASLRVWEFVAAGDGDGEWRQVAAMPPAMSHAFYGRKADVNCAGHGDRLMVCVSSGDGEANGCFMCDVSNNRWEELPECVNSDGVEVNDFLAAFSFEPRLEITV
uniref:F-box domain-containing protein n=1 Tax=Leersia perrieri TaxID=77586 RepID=A0A0D9VV04_9ORYZ